MGYLFSLVSDFFVLVFVNESHAHVYTHTHTHTHTQSLSLPLLSLSCPVLSHAAPGSLFLFTLVRRRCERHVSMVTLPLNLA